MSQAQTLLTIESAFEALDRILPEHTFASQEYQREWTNRNGRWYLQRLIDSRRESIKFAGPNYWTATASPTLAGIDALTLTMQLAGAIEVPPVHAVEPSEQCYVRLGSGSDEDNDKAPYDYVVIGYGEHEFGLHPAAAMRLARQLAVMAGHNLSMRKVEATS